MWWCHEKSAFIWDDVVIAVNVLQVTSWKVVNLDVSMIKPSSTICHQCTVVVGLSANALAPNPAPTGREADDATKQILIIKDSLIQNKFSRDWCLTNRVQEYRLIMN
jgi:hypothetical protein